MTKGMKLHNGIYAIHEDYLDSMSSNVERANQIEMGDRQEEFFATTPWARPYDVREGVLEIGVQGSLMMGMPYKLGGMITGYEYVKQAVLRGMDDENVKGIALMIDSPGGHVHEVFELCDVIASCDKPVQAFVSSMAHSAAYAVASAADKITMNKMARAGSIGVLLQHHNRKKMMEDIGLEVTFITAGKHKAEGNPFEPLSEDARQRLQDRVDEMYEIFATHVAENRGIEVSEVKKTEALTYSAETALSLGLIDAVQPVDDALAAFAASLSNSQKGVETMDDNNQNAEAANAAMADAARTEGIALGIKQERERLSAIMGLEEASDRTDTALKMALTTDLTSDQAKELLSSIPVTEVEEEEEPSASNEMFEQAMEASGNPEITQMSNQGEQDDVDMLLATVGMSRKSRT